MEPGSVSLALPYHIHQTISDKGAVIQKYCCQFDISLLFGSPYISEWFGRMYQIGTQLPSTALFREEEAAQIEQLFARLLLEYRNADLRGRNNMICNKLSEALIMFLRKAETDEQPAKAMDQDISDQLFWRALHYVHVHFAKRLTLDMIASHLHISATYVSRLFREKTGRSFLEYVHQLRVNSAASMLITSDRPIMDIAFRTGFESVRTFYRVFKEVKGQSPREYRNVFI
jgi:YesN/AraC family two-component response regulator